MCLFYLVPFLIWKILECGLSKRICFLYSAYMQRFVFVPSNLIPSALFTLAGRGYVPSARIFLVLGASKLRDKKILLLGRS